MMSGMAKGKSMFTVFSKGILAENPALRQMLGLCPTLAVTTAVTNGIGMGAATTFVLVCSGVVVSLLRGVIPTNMRLPAFITVIAGFVTLVMMIVEAYLPELNAALGIYLPLIVVNCIVLGRAEVFASKHPVREAALDGFGMGVGVHGRAHSHVGRARGARRRHIRRHPGAPRFHRAHDRVRYASGRLCRLRRAYRRIRGRRGPFAGARMAAKRRRRCSRRMHAPHVECAT